jgi:hypothetical protein
LKENGSDLKELPSWHLSGGAKEKTEHHGQDNRSAGRESKQAPSDHKYKKVYR